METINFTVKLAEGQATKLIQMLETTTQLVDFRILPNTEEMYDADPLFRELIKAKKSHKTAVEKYINEHNNKHKNK
tara:strand:+ start:548 stop:775 length:228 start_codon:yes stop_codon:yes gene_type:complete